MMTKKSDKFTFAISLSVLDHLGGNLYRSFATVLGEAISNAWDADAGTVRIDIDRDKREMFVRDDGIGMTADDLQQEFLKIGYSKRQSGASRSTRNRPFIGRKGIGKLAMLSCADRITVISKVTGGTYVGGTIDNSGLNRAITENLTPQEYALSNWFKAPFTKLMIGHDHGTIIRFEGLKEGIRNTVEYLTQLVALYFRFSLLDP